MSAFIFAKLRNVGASLSTALHHRPIIHPHRAAPTPIGRAHPRCRRLIPFCSRRNAENSMELEVSLTNDMTGPGST